MKVFLDKFVCGCVFCGVSFLFIVTTHFRFSVPLKAAQNWRNTQESNFSRAISTLSISHMFLFTHIKSPTNFCWISCQIRTGTWLASKSLAEAVAWPVWVLSWCDGPWEGWRSLFSGTHARVAVRSVGVGGSPWAGVALIMGADHSLIGDPPYFLVKLKCFLPNTHPAQEYWGSEWACKEEQEDRTTESHFSSQGSIRAYVPSCFVHYLQGYDTETRCELCGILATMFVFTDIPSKQDVYHLSRNIKILFQQMHFFAGLHSKAHLALFSGDVVLTGSPISSSSKVALLVACIYVGRKPSTFKAVEEGDNVLLFFLLVNQLELQSWQIFLFRPTMAWSIVVLKSMDSRFLKSPHFEVFFSLVQKDWPTHYQGSLEKAHDTWHAGKDSPGRFRLLTVVFAPCRWN